MANSMSIPECQKVSNESLMQRVRDNDDEIAFVDLYRRYSDKTPNFLRRKTRSSEEAHDLNQEVWAKVWIGRRTFKEGKEFDNWLWAIARHTFIDWCRRVKHQVITVPEEGSEAEMNVPYEGLDEEEREILRLAFGRAWDRLEPKEQEILRLVYLVHKEAPTMEKVGDILGLTQPTVRKLRRRAEKKLSQYLAEEGIVVELTKSEGKDSEENKEEGSQESQKEADKA